MTGRLARALTRLVSLTLLLVFIFGATRALVRALPGDPLQMLIAETGTKLPPDYLKDELGLGRPLLPSIAHDLVRALRGDWGVSILSQRPVLPTIRERFSNTLELSFLALVLSLSVSLVLGLAAAARRGSPVDRLCSLFGAVTAALPTPWIGPIFLIAFSLWIPLVPAGGHVVLPAVTLALSFAGLWSRLIRERVTETLATGAAPGARARGLNEWRVVVKYGLAPCAGPLVAYLGTQFGALLAGAFVTEVVFSWNGMGTLLVDSVLRRDYPVIEAATFVAAATTLLGTTAGDWLQDFIDPRRGSS